MGLRSESYSCCISSLSSYETADCKALVREVLPWFCLCIIAAMAQRKSDANNSIILIHGWNGITGRCCLVNASIFFAFQFIILTYPSAKQKQRRHWWEIHQRQFALKDIVLIGPAGVELS